MLHLLVPFAAYHDLLSHSSLLIQNRLVLEVESFSLHITHHIHSPSIHSPEILILAFRLAVFLFSLLLYVSPPFHRHHVLAFVACFKREDSSIPSSLVLHPVPLISLSSSSLWCLTFRSLFVSPLLFPFLPEAFVSLITLPLAISHSACSLLLPSSSSLSLFHKRHSSHVRSVLFASSHLLFTPWFSLSLSPTSHEAHTWAQLKRAARGVGGSLQDHAKWPTSHCVRVQVPQL